MVWRAPLCFCATVMMLAASAPVVRAETPVDFRGKIVNFVVSFEAGGPYDLYARVVARHLGSHLPGNPTVVVQNMPGAGGMLGMNYIYNVAPHDGTVFGVMSQTVALGQLLLYAPGVKYDVRKATWVGRINANVELTHGWYTTKFRTIDDAFAREIPVAGTGPTSSSVVFPRLLNTLVGTRFKVVAGYPSSNAAQLAMERGEVEAVGKTWSALKVQSADWLREKKIVLIMQYMPQRFPELADVPAVVEYAKTEEQRQILGLFASGGDLGTSVVAPPGLRPELTTTLRKAFMDTMNDPALREDVGTMKLDIAPLDGAEVQNVASSIFSIPAEVVERAKTISQQP